MSTVTTEIVKVENEPERVVRVSLLYNPFLINDVAKHELVYSEGKTLAEYLNGLPDEVEWAVAYNGEHVEPEDWASIIPHPESYILIVRVPEGGGGNGGGKQILRMVAMLGVIIAAAYLAGPLVGMLGSAFGGTAGLSATAISAFTAGATAALATAGGMIVNALLPASTVNPSGNSPSYSISGPKNTSQEGVPVPIIYGTMMVGGNVVDCYTVNIGNDQFLFMRIILNDGPIQDVNEIKLNGTDIYDVNDVEYRVDLGDGSAVTPNDWFSKATSLFNVQEHILNTSPVVYTTTQDVDAVRVDVTWPTGLISISTNSGTHYNKVVTLGINYRQMSEDGTTPLGDGSWLPLPLTASQPLDTSGSSGILTVDNASNIIVTLVPAAPTSGNTWSIEAQYREAGTTEWITYGTKTGAYQSTTVYPPAANNGDVNQNAYYNEAGLPYVNWTINFPGQNNSNFGNWEVQFIGGAVQDNTSSNPNLNNLTQNNLVGTANSLTVSRQTQASFTLTYQSSTLPRGRYEIQVTRTNADDTDQTNSPDACYVTDFGEIQNENVTYSGTANLSLKIKLNSSVSSIPTITAICDGCNDIKQYDADGNVTTTGWTNNPAWICCDILLNTLRGCSQPETNIDWPAVVSFAEWCDEQGFVFNGVFDFVTTMWDAVQAVAKIGHATFAPNGTKYTVVIDRPANPVMLFTGSNMYKETFKKNWIALNDRANEIQQKYYDQDNNYQEMTIRLPNVLAQTTANVIKPATIPGFGIISAAQATLEAEYQSRLNALINETITFDAPIEAIGLSLGDVALIQHDSTNYADGVGGRLAAGSTTTVLQLDRPVTMNAGQNYSITVIADALLIYNVNITNVSGNKITVTGIAAGTTLVNFCRLVQGSTDANVYKTVDLGTGSWVFSVDDPTGFVNGAAGCWDNDVLMQSGVEFVEGESTSVTLTTPLATTPVQYANWMFGQTATYQLPYRLKMISGDDDLYRRSLTFMTYNPAVYGSSIFGTPTVTGNVPTPVGQVTNLVATWDKTPNSTTQNRVNVTISWNMPNGTNYGGADIYYQDDQGAWTVGATVSNVTQWSSQYNAGDTVQFKVVAYDTTNRRADYNAAPIIQATLDVNYPVIAPPTALTASVAAFTSSATVDVAWTAPSVPVDSYQVDILEISTGDYAALVANNQSLPTDIATATWTVAGTTTGTSIQLQGISIADYVLRVSAKSGFSVSTYVYVPLSVAQPGIPASITGLKLNNGSGTTFTGSDATWTWNDVLTQQSALSGVAGSNLVYYWLDYEVQILDAASSALIRTEYTTSPSYAYTLAKNEYDCQLEGQTYPARRTFTISVTMRGAQGQVSSAVTQTVSNPAPALAAITPVVGIDSVSFTGTLPTDNDIVGMIIWASTTPGFTPGPSNIVFQGAPPGSFVAQPNQTYYYVYAFYDSFGTESLNVSSQAAFTTTGVTGSALSSDLSASLGSISSVVEDITTLNSSFASQLLLDSARDAYFTAQSTLNGQPLGVVVQTNQATQATQAASFVSELSLIGAKNSAGTAFVFNGSTTYVNSTQTLAQHLSYVTSVLGDGSTSIASILEQTNNLNANITLAVNSNGYITGLDVGTSGTPTSGYFDIVSPNFRLIDPSSGQSLVPLSYSSGTGWVFNSNVNINGDLIVSGSISTAAINPGSITNTTYAEAIVSVSLGNVGGPPVMIGSLTLNCSGAPLAIDAFVQINNTDGSHDNQITLTLERDSTQISDPFYCFVRQNSSGFSGGQPASQFAPFLDTAATAGSHTYAVYGQFTGGTSSGSAIAKLWRLRVQDLKTEA